MTSVFIPLWQTLKGFLLYTAMLVAKTSFYCGSKSYDFLILYNLSALFQRIAVTSITLQFVND